MTAIMSSTSSPATSPPGVTSPASSTSHPPLPPLITSPPTRRSTLPRPLSYASQHRLSKYSVNSARSRPPSQLFPLFPSSLPYTLVRDFAYAPVHPMHYGPPPEPSGPPSGMTTPASEQRRLSDPPASWESKMSWDTGGWTADGYGKGGDVPPIHLGDGPPWSEDEDLQSPVVSSRHRKHKSSGSYGQHTRARSAQGASSSSVMNPANYDPERGFYVGTSGNGSERYYVNQGGEANGPGGEYVTYPPDQARHSNNPYQLSEQQPRQYAENNEEYGSDASSGVSSPGFGGEDQSRYSRDYQFTITSPDEEMHGKAVALYDFERESDNELPLVEGQIILISYRHGEGWLVAEDPRTQESGLVPEAYVRLLREIEGGMNSLAANLGEGTASPVDVGTPTQAEHGNVGNFGHTPTTSNASNGYHQPIVSTFSTSSRDLEGYPTQALGLPPGQAPPQVVHYHGQRGGSQANTPTVLFHDTGLRRGSQDLARRGSQDARRGSDTVMTPVQEAKFEPNKGTEKPTKRAEEAAEKPRDVDAMDTDR